MKVYKCEQDNRTNELTYSQILKKEGIYKFTRFRNVYVVVIEYTDENTVALYHDAETNELQPLSSVVWKEATFYEVKNARLYFEIKEG